MKFFKLLLAFAILTGIMMIACGDPEEADPDQTWTVTFDVGTTGGFFDNLNNPATTQTITVQDGGTASVPNCYKDWTPTTAGLYTYLIPTGWRKQGTTTGTFNFETTKITENITLNPVFGATNTALQGSMSFVNAIPRVNTEAKPCILVLGGTAENISSSLELTAHNAGLKVIGNTATNLTINANNATITVGKAFGSGKREDSTIVLIIGNNITFTGKTGNTNSVVWIRNGAVFTMDGTSKITGNTNTGATMLAGYGAAAIHVDNADFIMKGGQITANTNGVTQDIRWASAGAVYAEDYSRVTLTGGSITENLYTSTGETKDFYITNTSTITIGGTATVGVLGLTTSETNNANGFITVQTGFTGSVKLNLRSNNNNASAYWSGKQILFGNFNSTDVSKFTLGKFISQTTAVDMTGKSINNNGVLSN